MANPSDLQKSLKAALSAMPDLIDAQKQINSAISAMPDLIDAQQRITAAMASMPSPIALQQSLNAAISSLHQSREALRRAQRAGELIEQLRLAVNEVAKIRRTSVAEAVQWPGESIATIAAKLDLSKSAVAKLITPEIKNAIAEELRTRLAQGFNPPPSRPE